MQLALIRYALVFVLGVVLGTYFTGKDAAATLANLRADHAVELAKTRSEEAKRTATAKRELEATQQQIAQLDTKNHGRLEAQRNEIERLNSCLRTGTCGLRVNATCPGDRDRGGIANAATPGVDDGKGATLTPVAESAYFALRHGINENESKLMMCQEYVGTLWDRVQKLQATK